MNDSKEFTGPAGYVFKVEGENVYIGQLQGPHPAGVIVPLAELRAFMARVEFDAWPREWADPGRGLEIGAVTWADVPPENLPKVALLCRCCGQPSNPDRTAMIVCDWCMQNCPVRLGKHTPQPGVDPGAGPGPDEP